MPGPAAYYRNNAERQRAYRRRKADAAAADLADAQLILTYAYVLQTALQAARRSGSRDPLLAEIEREDPIETLRALADHFYEQAGTPPEARPWRQPPREGRPSRPVEAQRSKKGEVPMEE